jgi:hypothetical protein
MTLALGVATGLLEPAGVPFVGAINAVSYLAWALWLMVVGAVLLARRPGIAAQPLAAGGAR